MSEKGHKKTHAPQQTTIERRVPFSEADVRSDTEGKRLPNLGGPASSMGLLMLRMPVNSKDRKLWW